jgi:hypothetical protein
MVRVNVTSSDVSSVMYDEASRLMEVDFVKNGPYTYFNVTPDVYSAFISADSKGKFVYRVLRRGYNYQRGPMVEAAAILNLPLPPEMGGMTL